MNPIYLDYNATTPIAREVAEAMVPYLYEYFGNPSSSHPYGVATKRAVEAARAQVADLLGCEAGEVIFTSGGTESNNYAIKGVALAHRERGNHIITSAIEHPAVIKVCTWLEEQGRSSAVAARFMAVFALAVAAGSLLGGALSDRLGRWQLLALCLILLGPTLWVLLRAPAWGQIPAIVVMGTLVGATFPISIVMAQETWPRGVGTASGLVMGLGWVPGGLGASLTGVLADRSSLTTALRWLVLPAALSAACILAYDLVRRSSPASRSVEPVADGASAE